MTSTAVSASANAPVLGDAAPQKPSAADDIIIRPARLADIPVMANIAYDAYSPSYVTHWLMPEVHVYREDAVRIHRQAIMRRFGQPRNLSIVACRKSDPSRAIASGQFHRLGDDDNAREYVRSQGLRQRAWMFLLSWLFFYLIKIENMIWQDRVSNKKNVSSIEAGWAKDAEKYWNSYPERRNRWHANSVIVNPHFQGKGVGKKIMLEVMKRAQKERVIMGLTASGEGEILYRKLGFEMLGDFTCRIPGDDRNRGGIMIWYPEGMDHKD